MVWGGLGVLWNGVGGANRIDRSIDGSIGSRSGPMHWESIGSSASALDCTPITATTLHTQHTHTHTEFRLNAHETDPAKIASHQETAVRGLSQLQAYTGLRDADANWEVKMEGTWGCGCVVDVCVPLVCVHMTKKSI